MFERISNSWELVKASAAVLRTDTELLVFPVVSAALSLLVVATFAVPVILAGIFDSAALMILVAALVVLALVFLALVSSALGGVYAAAVYRYAAEGEAGTFFTPGMVQNAFKRK